MAERIKNIIILLLTGAFIMSMLVFQVLSPDKKLSDTERRALQSMPKVNAETIKSATFMKDFETYTQDQFPFRDTFRKLKVQAALNLFKQKEVHDLYLYKGYIAKMEYPKNQVMIEHAAERFKNIYEMYLKDTDVQIFSSIVPDKNYFLGSQSGHLAMDYDQFIEGFKGLTDYMKYIDIRDQLSIQDYYYTDTHWRQEALIPVAQVLAEVMHTTVLNKEDYETKAYDKPFYGVYVGQLGLSVAPDTINYLTNQTLEQCVVTSYDTGKPVGKPMSNFEKASGKDAYELFLSGSDALLTIENPNATTNKELVLFRDSFGSSIAPLLVSGYQKVTLVDMRYINSALIGKFIDFKDQDVLFLYSTLVLNNSMSLK